jgi:signal transduction histidine kinase
VARSAADSIRHDVEKGGGAIVIGELDAVWGDRLSIEQIVDNLLSNAVKYVPASRPAQVRMWTDQTGEGTIIHVKDNGCGIAEADIPRAFELFRRVGKLKTVGEGMGLPYVQTLVRRHHGRIWCDSVVDEGTTFHVFLPSPVHTQNREREIGDGCCDDPAGRG